MPETSQVEADRLLVEDQAARLAAREGQDVETQLRIALAAIDREAKERAEPILARLAIFEAAKPPRLLAIMPDGWTPIGRAWLDRGGNAADPVFAEGASGTAMLDIMRRASQDALGAPFGRAPYSKPDQVRNALLEAFSAEPVPIRRDMRDAIESAKDETLIRLARLLKHSADG